MDFSCGQKALGAIEDTSRWGHAMIQMDFSQTPKGYAPEQLLKHFVDFSNAMGKLRGVLQGEGEFSLSKYTEKCRGELEVALRLPKPERTEELTNILNGFVRTVEGESFAVAIDEFEKCLKGD